MSEITPEMIETALGIGPQADVSGVSLVCDIQGYCRRFIAYPSPHDLVAHVLWIVHAHLMDKWESTPRLAFLSPEPASGKSRALEVTETLVPRPVCSVNASPAYLFRRIADPEGPPTLLYDEIDTVFGPKAKENEEIRGVLNAGHRRGATAGRCVVRGREVFTEELPAYCAVALAGLGDLPDTILTRSVIIRMKRRAPHEQVEPYRRRIHASEGHRLRDLVAAWCEQVADRITWPELPPEIEDRNADVWEPLVAVADAIGGEWPELARAAAIDHVRRTRESSPSLGIKLLSDLFVVFKGHSVMSTATLLEALHAMEESPWADLKGSPLAPRGLARLLGQYGITRRQIRIGSWNGSGYRREDFIDAWTRYPPPQPSDSSQTSQTSQTKTTPGDVDELGVNDVCDVCEKPPGERAAEGEEVRL